MSTGPTSTRTHSDELAELLIDVPHLHFGTQPEGDRGYTLITALAEIQEWLEVQPTKEQQRQRHRDSLLTDITAALELRGTAVRQLTPTATPLLQSMDVLLNRPAQGDAAVAQEHLANLLAELANLASASAAFDDLTEVVNNPEASPRAIADRLDVLTDILTIADRPVAETCHRLGDVVHDRALEIGFLRHDLDGVEPPVVDDDNFYALANLEFDQRVDLCHRYLQQPPVPGHHVVWVAYNNARVMTDAHWREEVGPVEFFDGPTLLKAIENPDDVWVVEPLPPELTTGYQASRLTREDWPSEKHTHWVAARIDLSTQNVSDPVAVGRAQADGVVQLARFKGTKSTWTPLAGFFHLVDGLARSWVAFHVADSLVSAEVDFDTTAGWFGRLANEIGPHLPVTDRTLRRLLETVRTLNTLVDVESPDYVGICVRVVEFVSRQCEADSWAQFLLDHAGAVFAYNYMHTELFNATQAAIYTSQLDNRSELLGAIRTTLPDNRISMHLRAALEMAPGLLGSLTNTHHAATRRLAEVVRRTSSGPAVQAWAADLVAEHKTKILRTSRYRNGQMHGGADAEVARTVSRFAHHQARTVARRALEATLDGQTVSATYLELKLNNEAWIEHLTHAEDAADALFWTRK